MPKNRKKSGTRKLEKRLFIICEGKKNKSESAYFKALIKTCKFEGEKVKVSVKDTKKNTGKELVKEAKKIKEFDIDEAWVVYDKDGYTKHAETFSSAEDSRINIAFSSICFEYWILLHFEYTTKPFEKCDKVKRHIKKTHWPEYEKGLLSAYTFLEERLKSGCTRAENLRSYQNKSNPNNAPIYEMNPYTNVDELIAEIFKLQDVE